VAGGTGLLMTPSCRAWLRTARHPAMRGLVKRLEVPQQVTATALPQARPAVPLLLRVPSSLLASEQGGGVTPVLEELLDEFQLGLGLTLPRIHVHGQPGDAAAGRWELLAFEVPIAHGRLPDVGFDAHAAIGEPVRQALRRHAPLFLGIQDTTNLLTRASLDAPDVVKEVLRALPVQRVADVLRRLVGEAVSIRNLRDILEALSEAGQRDKDAHALTEFSRIALRRQISHQAAPDGQLPAVLLEPALEDLLRQAVRVTGGVAQLALDPDTARGIAAAITASIGQRRPRALITAIDVRWHVRKLIEPECFDTPVLSYHELMPTLQLDVLDRVGVPTPMLEAS
jgi:type III secretion protein V